MQLMAFQAVAGMAGLIALAWAPQQDAKHQAEQLAFYGSQRLHWHG